MSAAATSFTKRILDVFLSSVAFVLLLPVLAVVALVVTADAGWPPLFLQTRVGLDGKRFTCLKFRTMVRNAHQLRPALEAQNEAPFPTFKIRKDPRLTRTGSFLRKSSIDELPQLLNVIAGQMSLVGPRPPLPSEVDHYDALAMRRLSSRPGLTCIWQIEHRHSRSMTFAEWLASDLDYLENWSIGLDLRLMLRTVRAVARLSGD